MKRLVEKLRGWLEIEAPQGGRIDKFNKLMEQLNRRMIAYETDCGDLIQLREKLHTLELGQDALAQKDSELESLIGRTAQDLQSQITALGSVESPLAKVKPPEEEPIQVMPGHQRWSDRKRAYEASKRKPLITQTGQQIADNARLIAAGVRKSDTESSK
jgi:hypothetical protein